MVMCTESPEFEFLTSTERCKLKSSFVCAFDLSKMVRKSIVVGLLVLLVAAVGTFVGVFFGIGKRTKQDEKAFFKAAVAADAGTCSEIGR